MFLSASLYFRTYRLTFLKSIYRFLNINIIWANVSSVFFVLHKLCSTRHFYEVSEEVYVITTNIYLYFICICTKKYERVLAHLDKSISLLDNAIHNSHSMVKEVVHLSRYLYWNVLVVYWWRHVAQCLTCQSWVVLDLPVVTWSLIPHLQVN